MKKIKNKKSVQKLSFRMLIAKRQKNLIEIFAISLTSILFTALFIIGGSMIESFQESTMRQVGGRAMAGIKYILPEDYDKLSKNAAVKNPSYRIIISGAENKELLKLSTEINYATDKNAENMFCFPTHGNMPQERLEVATSTLVLDALNLPYELGETVTLEFSIHGEKITQDFILSGYWEGDRVAQAQMCFLSREYCDEVAQTPKVSFLENNEADYAGYWNMDFDFSNSWNIEKKTKELLKQNGYKPKNTFYGINWAYTTDSIDIEFVLFFISVLFLILISGYLIICNVFSLNIAMDIQSYGLYKTIGMTEKQLKKLIHGQAIFLSIVGIPISLILGTMIGKWLFPVIIKSYNVSVVKSSIHPLFLFFSFIFSFLTVWISCHRPCRLVSKVSPIEAMKYSDVSKIGRKKEKRIRKITPCSFGWANLGRNRRKMALTVSSLSLSLIILNLVYTSIHGFSLDTYVSHLIIGDAIVCDATVLNFQTIERNFSGVSQEMQESLENMEGIEKIHNIYYSSSEIFLDDVGMEMFDMSIKGYEEQLEYEMEWVKNEHQLDCQLYGIDEFGKEQLEYYDGSVDWEKFQTGNYVLVSPWNLAWSEKESDIYYKSGEKIMIGFLDGTKKEYEVMAVADIPYAISSRIYNPLNITIILPETEYLAHTEDKGALYTILSIEDEKKDTAYENIKNYTENVETGLNCVLKKSYEEDFRDYINTYWIVGGSLSFALAMIGILNFINVVFMGILTRKKEFAMMEAVGMTGNQMKKMLVWEGTFYALLTAITSIFIGVILEETILKKMMTQVWFFEFRFTIMPIIICLPIMLIIACVIPIISYKYMTKESVVERLREKE